MNTKIFFMSLAFFLVVALAPLANAATYHDSFSVDVGDASINIEEECEEDWSGSTWGACVNNQQIFICFDKNNCGTEDLKPEKCWTTQTCGFVEPYCGDGLCNNGETCSTCPTDCGACSTGGGSSGGSSGGGGGGGGSGSNNNNLVQLSETETQANCVEKWECEEWSNSDNSCGVRICTDTNNCGTTELKPETSRECPSIGFFGISGITGAVIGFVKTGAGIGVSIALLIIIMGIVVIAVSKKKQKRVNKIKTEQKDL